MKKALRYQQQKPKDTSPALASTLNIEESPSMPSINTNISILSICSCPDITFKNYTPHGDRPNGMTVEKWRQLQTTIGSQSSKYQLRVPYKPSICLLTSLGSTIIVDLEVCKFFLNILL